MYRQPIVGMIKLTMVGEQLLRSCLKEYKNIVLMGDLNVNMLAGNTALSNLLEIYGFKNLVNTPTCYKGEEGTLLDIVATNVPKRFQGISVKDIGLGDFHSTIFYRSYKYFFNTSKEDFESVPFPCC